MGKRSRRQERIGRRSTGERGAGAQSPSADRAAPPADSASGSDAAGGRAHGERLRRRAAASAAVAERSIKARPPAPWDPFPLTELGILLGLICLVVGLFVSGDLQKAMLAAGFTLAVLGGLDTTLREHFNGYRSHAGMLAGILALLALAFSTAVLRIGFGPRAAIAIAVFALVFPALRRDFIRRSGGRRA